MTALTGHMTPPLPPPSLRGCDCVVMVGAAMHASGTVFFLIIIIYYYSGLCGALALERVSSPQTGDINRCLGSRRQLVFLAR